MNQHFADQPGYSPTSNYPRSSLWSLLGASLLAFVLISTGCSSPMALTPKAPDNTGTLSIAVPHIATWARQLAGSGSLTAASRAYIVADRLVIEVKDAGGNAVITPTAVEPTMMTDYSPAQPYKPSTITGIPVGANYTVVISVYNHAVSSTEPVVRGQATGIAVTLGQTTPVAISCLPVSPQAITVDGGPWTKPLSPNGEYWYALPVTNGSAYYIVNNGPVGLFNADGVPLPTGSILPYVATYTGTIYLGVVDFDGFAGYSALGSSVLNVTTTEPVTNEGSPASPVPLTLNSNHTFRLGPAQGSYGSSYYSFTTTSAGDYVLDSDLYYFYPTLYSDSTFTTALLNPINSVDFGLSLGSLAANTTYYLKLKNGFDSSKAVAGQVMDSAQVASSYQGQGTAVAPVLLTLGTPQAAQVGTHFFDSGSFYSFITGAGSDYAIEVLPYTANGLSMTFTLYSNSSYSSSITSLQFHGNGTLFAKLTPNTTYYLKASNDYNAVRANFSPTFTFRVDASVSVPEVVEGSLALPVEVSLNTPRTFKVAASGSGYSSYYRFTTTDPGDYAFDTELTGLNIYLYLDSGFSNLHSSSTYSSYGRTFAGLAGGTTYYLKTSGTNSSAQSNLGQIVDPSAMAVNYEGDGSLATPVALAVGTSFSGKVGNHTYDNKSYYSFTTGTGLEYSIKLTGIPSRMTVVGTLHGNPTFTNQLINEYFSGQRSINLTLSPNTTYYFQTFNYPNNGDIVVPYSIIVETTPPPSFLTLPITTAGASYMSGAIANPNELVWYEADVVPGTTYTLKWDDFHQGSGTYTRDVDVSAYHANRSTAFFTNADSGYTTVNLITIPAGETKLYIRVRSYGGSSSTGTFGIKLY